MTELPSLRTPRLVLRPFAIADAPSVQRLAGAWEVAGTTLHVPHPYEDGMAEAWIATHPTLFANRETAAFAITGPDDALVGAISLRFEPVHDRAELGYWIGVPFWGHGYATEAARAIRDFGFDVLALNRIQASYLPRNPASGRVMQKIGMRYEGLRRKHVFAKGQFEDVIEYAMLRDDLRPAADAAIAPAAAVSIASAPHYPWGEGCDGWHLVREPSLSVIQERMPPGAREVRHWHARARQFFQVLRGVLTMDLDGVMHTLHDGDGIEIAPGTPHQALNTSNAPVEFLVTSNPPSHGDRIHAS